MDFNGQFGRIRVQGMGPRLNGKLGFDKFSAVISRLVIGGLNSQMLSMLDDESMKGNFVPRTQGARVHTQIIQKQERWWAHSKEHPPQSNHLSLKGLGPVPPRLYFWISTCHNGLVELYTCPWMTPSSDPQSSYMASLWPWATYREQQRPTAPFFCYICVLPFDLWPCILTHHSRFCVIFLQVKFLEGFRSCLKVELKDLSVGCIPYAKLYWQISCCSSSLYLRWWGT